MYKKLFLLLAICICVSIAAIAYATLQNRVATKARVEADLNKDIALTWEPLPRLEGRTCLDGRPVADFQGDIVEYWANIECLYCDIQQVTLAQRDNPEICIVVRHSPTEGYSESVKKALSYESLREYSVNAANQFWLAVMPKTNIAIPSPYGSALQTALQEAAIDMEKFSETLTGIAKERVSEDIVASRQRIRLPETAFSATCWNWKKPTGMSVKWSNCAPCSTSDMIISFASLAISMPKRTVASCAMIRNIPC